MFHLRIQTIQYFEYITVWVNCPEMRIWMLVVYYDMKVSVLITSEFFDAGNSNPVEPLDQLLCLMLIDVWAKTRTQF